MSAISRLLVTAAALAAAAFVAEAMPPCKRCGAERLHSRDDLLAMDDGDLNEMKAKLEKEVPVLEEELDALQEKHSEETGALQKRLAGINGAYQKLSQDSVKRTAKFSSTKADAAKKLDVSIDDLASTNGEIEKLHDAEDKMRSYLNPYVDKLISGEGWPPGCKCEKAKALLQQLQATLWRAGVPTSEGALLSLHRADADRGQLKPSDLEKYKLVRSIQELEEKRAKLMHEKTEDITSFSTQQRIMLDRIDAANVKSQLKKTTEQKYEDSDKLLAKGLDSQLGAAGRFLDSAQGRLARLKKHQKDAQDLFVSFKDALKKCKCL